MVRVVCMNEVYEKSIEKLKEQLKLNKNITVLAILR